MAAWRQGAKERRVVNPPGKEKPEKGLRGNYYRAPERRGVKRAQM